jgi:outer membrane protein OmpA-like peptidoglycan-associated protein
MIVKKLLVLSLMAYLTFAGWFLSPAAASTNGLSTDDPGKWDLQVGLGLDLPGSNWQSAYNLGPGGGLALGYEFDPAFYLGLDLEDFYFSGTNWSGAVSDNDLRVLPILKYYFLKEGFRPYLLAGAGVDIEFLSSSLENNTPLNFDTVVGAGVEIPLSSGMGLFVEGKYNLLVFGNGATAGDVPLLAGLTFDLSSSDANGNNNQPLAQPNLVPRLVASKQVPQPTPQPVVYLTVKTVKDETTITGFARGENEFEFKAGDLKTLQDIVDYLRVNPGKGLVLKGYTDPVGDDAVNEKLSIERARWIERYLLKMGVPAAKIWSVKGLGAKDPVGDNRTEEGMAMNRRVLIHIVK